MTGCFFFCVGRCIFWLLVQAAVRGSKEIFTLQTFAWLCGIFGWLPSVCLKLRFWRDVTVFIRVCTNVKKGQGDVVVVVSTWYTSCSAYVNGNLGGICSPRIEIRVNLHIASVISGRTGSLFWQRNGDAHQRRSRLYRSPSLATPTNLGPGTVTVGNL